MTNRPALPIKTAASAFIACAFLVTMALPTVGRAQATTTTTDTTTTTQTSSAPVPTPQQVSQAGNTGANEIVKMSPFEVHGSSKDAGYYAQNTLAGTRLNTSTADLGASITIVTKQQMQDTSSVNINDLFLYEASTEGTENFTAVGSPSKGEGVADAIQNSPQTSTRLRGLGAPDIARDYYITIPAIQLDAYNLDRIEINRGPNSTLFGIGSPSGIVNESIEQAVLNKDTNEISAREGSFGDFRSTINFNRALIPDKLAIAVAGLYANAHPTGQQPEYDIQRREFGTFTLKPFATTTIRASVEYYDNPNRRANSITPVDEITPWINGGRPSWDPITYTATVNGVTTAPISNLGGTGANPALPPGLYTNLANFDISSPVFYVNQGKVQLWEQMELGTNFNTPGSPITATPTIGPIGNEIMLQSGGQYAKYASSAPAGQVTYPLFREPGVSNKQLLNYQGVNTLSTNYGEDKAQIYNVEVEQQITDNLFLDAGWYRENFNTLQHNYQGQNIGNMLAVDPNTRLLNGTPNPYFGRPYMTLAVPSDFNSIDLNEQERISLAYQLDFTKNDNWTKWLGHHNVMAFYQHRENDTTSFSYRQVVLDAHSWTTTTDIAGSANTTVEDGIEEKLYMSNAGSAVSYGPGEIQNNNYTFPVTWYNTALNGGTWTSENAKVGPVITSGTKNQQQVWSYSGGLQDYFLNDRLVITLGQRHDYERLRSTLSGGNIDTATGLDDLDNLSQFGTWTQTSGITRQAGGVLHLTKWLSVHYNQSDNFSPASLAEDGFGNVLPNPTGHGKDYGFALSFFDDKLVAELNWYKADVSNSREGTTTYISRATRIDFSQFIPWAQEVATENLGAGASGTAINNYANNVMKNPTGLQNFLNGSAHLSDTQTVTSKGIEFNLIYNPLKNWTIKATADQNQSVDSAVFPHVLQFIAARLPVWSTTTDPVLGPFWTTVNAGGINGLGSTSPQQWLSEFVYAGGLDVQLAQQNHIQPDLSKYHYNLLTNYQFVDGKLAGFGVGTAFRYETPAAIGYYGGPPDPTALGAIDSLQPFNPILGKEVIHQDAWISYKQKLPWLDQRIRATLQLNVRDLWTNGYLLAVSTNPDGTPQLYRVIPPRQWYLQETFDF